MDIDKETKTWSERPESSEKEEKQPSDGEAIQLERKKLSGAQRRRLKREREMAKGMRIDKAPHPLIHQVVGNKASLERWKSNERMSQAYRFTTTTSPLDLGRRLAEVQTKRLSGSQERKLERARIEENTWMDRRPRDPSIDRRRKASSPRMTGRPRESSIKRERIAADTWMERKPYESPRDQKRIAASTRIDRRPRESSIDREHVGSNGSYRGHIASPPRGLKRHRSPDVRTEPCEADTRSYRMAVTHQRHPDVMLSRMQADLIQAKVIAAIDEIPDGDRCPQFHQSKFNGGVLWMTCANHETRNFFLGVIREHAKFWEGATLTVLEASDLPKTPELQLRVPETSEESIVRARIRKQNPELVTEDWLLVRRKVDDEGQTLTYSMDHKSFKVLDRVQFKVFWGLGKVVFQELHEDRSEGGAGEPSRQF